MQIHKLLAYCLCIGVFLTLSASASYIQLIPTVSSPDVIQGQSAEIRLNLINKGDEAASNVQLALILPEGFTSNNIFYSEIQPNIPLDNKFTVTIPDQAQPGTYSVGILTTYADANQYQFSSVNSMTLIYKNPAMNMVSGNMNNIELRQNSETTNLTLRNRNEKSHALKIKLVLPNELKADNTIIETDIDSNGQKTIPVTISSVGALPGSTYPIIAVITYIEDNQHYSSIARGVVFIPVAPTQNPMPFPIWMPLLGLVLLIGVIIVAMLWRSSRKQKSRK
jgi:uncharacterized membrane protein